MSFYGKDKTTVVAAAEDEVDLEEMVDRMAVLAAVAKEMQKVAESVKFYVGKAVMDRAMTLDELPTKAENTADLDDELDDLDRQIEAEIAAQMDEDDDTVVSVPGRGQQRSPSVPTVLSEMLSSISNRSPSADDPEGAQPSVPPGFEDFASRLHAESRGRVLESSSDDEGGESPATTSDAADIMKIAMDDFEAAAKRQTHLIIDNVLEQLQIKVNEKLIERLRAPSDTMTMESNATLRKAAANHETLYNELDTVFNRQKECQDRVAELQKKFMKAETDISREMETENVLRRKRLQKQEQIQKMDTQLLESPNEAAWVEQFGKEQERISLHHIIVNKKLEQQILRVEEYRKIRATVESDRKATIDMRQAYERNIKEILSERIDISFDTKPKKALMERKLAEFGPLTTNDLKFTRDTKPQTAAQVELVMTSMLCQYPVQLAPLAPQWLRICAEKQLGKYSTVPPNLVAQFDGQAVPNASLISLSTEYGRKYADANAEAYRLWNLHHAEVMSDCNQSYHKTDTGDGADVRGCPNDLITALFIIVSKHEERGWTDRHARESMYINSPDYLATCKKIETFIQVMQKPMMESIRLKVRIPFSVCIKIAKGLQRRDNAFVDLATRYSGMDPRKLGIESDALSTLHGMLGEISSIARASGITTLRHEVAASAAHVSSGNTEFRASAVKVSGPKWDGRDKPPKGNKNKVSDGKSPLTCAAKGCDTKLTDIQSQGTRQWQEKAGKKVGDHSTICDVHFNEMIEKGSVELRPDSSGKQRKRKSNKYQKANKAECLREVTPTPPSTATASAASIEPQPEPSIVEIDDSLSDAASMTSTASDFVKVPSSGDSPGFIMDPDGRRFYEPIVEVAESTERKYSLSEFRELQMLQANQASGASANAAAAATLAPVHRPSFDFQSPASAGRRS